jgi:hypothetical protein
MTVGKIQSIEKKLRIFNLNFSNLEIILKALA